jgi:NAD-dependent dihydropyrimidine dehydrogenase PreA subunit
MKYLKNVVTLQYDSSKCTGCGRCLEVCPHRVFQPDGKKVKIADRDACMECGACAGNCPFGALEVHKGVGCAVAILYGMLTGNDPSCG